MFLHHYHRTQPHEDFEALKNPLYFAMRYFVNQHNQYILALELIEFITGEINSEDQLQEVMNLDVFSKFWQKLLEVFF